MPEARETRHEKRVPYFNDYAVTQLNFGDGDGRNGREHSKNLEGPTKSKRRSDSIADAQTRLPALRTVGE